MTIDLTEPIEVRMRPPRSQRGSSQPVAYFFIPGLGVDRDVVEAYREMFEAAPRMLALLKNIDDKRFAAASPSYVHAMRECVKTLLHEIKQR